MTSHTVPPQVHPATLGALLARGPSITPPPPPPTIFRVRSAKVGGGRGGGEIRHISGHSKRDTVH